MKLQAGDRYIFKDCTQNGTPLIVIRYGRGLRFKCLCCRFNPIFFSVREMQDEFDAGRMIKISSNFQTLIGEVLDK